MANIRKIAAVGKKIKLAKPTAKESILKPVITHYGKSSGISYAKAQREIKEKQIFVVINENTSTPESLLNVPGLSFTCEFPPQESQLLQSAGDSTVQWKFSNSAVWIQLPSSYFESSNQEKLLGFYQELAHFKPQNTLSGVLFVVGTDRLIKSEREELNNASAKLQKQLLVLNRNIGVTPPVYFLFDKTDSVGGFNYFFGDESGRWDEQLLGTNLLSGERNTPVRDIVPAKIDGVIEQIRMIELKMMVREKETTTRRGISAFSKGFTTLKETTSDFITQLLSPVNSMDSNVLGGFFFAAVTENEKQQKRSFFIKPVIQSVIPEIKSGASHTTEKKKNLRTKTILSSIVSLIVLGIFFGLLLTGSSKLNKWERVHAQSLTRPITYNDVGMKNLQQLYKSYIETAKHLEGKKSATMHLLGYDPKPISEAIRTHYYKALHTAFTFPGTKVLYKDLYSAVIDGSSDMANQFMPLKNTLRTYLACSAVGPAYPTLFENEILAERITPIITEQFFAKTTPTNTQKEELEKITESYLTLLKSGELKSPYKPKEKVITATQNRLVSLFDVKVVYQTTIESLKKKGTNLFLFDLIPEANEVNMNSEVSLHDVYTPKAWQDFIGKEIKTASTRLNSVEKWVVGKNDNRMSGSFTNPDKLYRGMVKFYLDDTREQWRSFVKSINLYRYNSLYEASHVMLKLGSSNSAIGKTFEKFNGMTQQFKELGGSEKEGDLFLAFADSLEIFHEVINNLASYQAYMKKTGSAISDHRKKGTLCTVFNGSEQDPLYNLYNYVKRSMLPQLSQKDQDIVSTMLYQPYERTKKSLTKTISQELNDVWKSEVADPFNKLFKGKYPFASTAKNADYSTVMEFFSPTVGPVWKAYNSSLSGYITKYRGQYQTRKRNGMVPVTVSKDVLNFYAKADLIKRVFFTEDGKPKIWSFSVTPTKRGSLKSAVFTVGDITGDVMEVGALRFKWPESKGSLVMKFTDRHNNPGLSQKHGEWVVMQEMNKASLAATSQRFVNRFPAQFTVTAFAKNFSLRSEVVVSSPNHPFSYNPFNGLTVSTKFSR